MRLQQRSASEQCFLNIFHYPLGSLFRFFFFKSPSSHEILMPQVYSISIYTLWLFRGIQNILISKISLSQELIFNRLEVILSLLRIRDLIIIIYTTEIKSSVTLSKALWIIRFSIHLLGTGTLPSPVSVQPLLPLILLSSLLGLE